MTGLQTACCASPSFRLSAKTKILTQSFGSKNRNANFQACLSDFPIGSRLLRLFLAPHDFCGSLCQTSAVHRALGYFLSCWIGVALCQDWQPLFDGKSLRG